MPKKSVPLSWEDRVTESWLEDAQKVAEKIASEAGPPPGGGKLSESEAIRLYGQADQNVDYDDVLASLLSTGLPPEQVEQMEIARERPEWAELYLQPVQDSQMATWLAVMAEYPYRAGLVLDYSDDPEEQVKRDEHLFKGWQKTLAEQDQMMMQPPEEGASADV